MGDQPAAAPVGVASAIVLGLIASFVQSLGLTIQRKSHLQNEALPTPQRRTEWKRPLWLFGFAVFLCANIGGTVFQIGALPIVMLAPLGAVSLLYNALLARYLLNDFLSTYMILGTALIATGAVLIGYFGVVPSPPHDLDELLNLYGRPTFVAFATIFVFVFAGVLVVSHLAEWQLQSTLVHGSCSPSKTKTKRKSSRSRLRRRWSAPTLAPVAEVSESNSGIATPVLAIADEMARRSAVFNEANAFYDPAKSAAATMTMNGSRPIARNGVRDYGTISRGPPPKGFGEAAKKRVRRSSVEVPRLEARRTHEPIDEESVKKTKLMLAVAYGGASGTMSGACLLLAKSGVELLMLSFSGHNQFVRWQSWMLIVVLLVAALLQLWYLNKALKMADPTLVCPLAFCFYNTSSIALGLVYFDQLGALAWYDIFAVAVGISVLLSGVWIVSLHGNQGEAQGGDETASLLSASSVAESRSLDRAEETEGLLANAAGIAGPHLPVDMLPSSDSTSDLSMGPHFSSPEAIHTPLDLCSSPTRSRRPSLSAESPTSAPSKGSNLHKRRSSSAKRRPTITLDFPIPGSILLPGPPPIDDLERAGGAFHEDGTPRGKHRSALYNTILEHGLSIGLSPSSPGFHLQPRSPSAYHFPSSQSGPIHGSERPKRNARRAMSEADVGAMQPIAAAAAAAGEEQSLEDREAAAGGPGFAMVPDQGLLRRKLEQLRRGGRNWSPLRRLWGKSEGDADASLETTDEAEEAAGADGTAGLGIRLGGETTEDARPLRHATPRT
ncbi:hypothetical protein ACQY0O_001035 [Thecaphora frezii]